MDKALGCKGATLNRFCCQCSLINHPVLILRYGLPADFQAMVLLPKNKAQKKLRDALNKTYAHLEPAGLSGLDHSEYYPYVYHKINIDMYGKSGFSM